MPATTEDFIDAFRASAKRAETDAGAIPFVAIKYSILFNHQATSPDDRQTLTTALTEVELAWLNKIADPRPSMTIFGATAIMENISTKLLAPESQEFIPQNAPEAFAEVALKLATRGETLEWTSIVDPEPEKQRDYLALYRDELLQLTRHAAMLADKFKEAVDTRTTNVTTVQPVTPSRPIQLKHAGASA
jgi:hypothetical protein